MSVCDGPDRARQLQPLHDVTGATQHAGDTKVYRGDTFEARPVAQTNGSCTFAASSVTLA
jgi:hypothetical protein